MDYDLSPVTIFESRKDELIPLEINGIKTYALKMSDDIGNYFAIPLTDSNLQPFPHIIQGHFIRQVDFDTYNGHPAILKAYY